MYFKLFALENIFDCNIVESNFQEICNSLVREWIWYLKKSSWKPLKYESNLHSYACFAPLRTHPCMSSRKKASRCLSWKRITQAILMHKLAFKRINVLYTLLMEMILFKNADYIWFKQTCFHQLRQLTFDMRRKTFMKVSLKEKVFLITS